MKMKLNRKKWKKHAMRQNDETKQPDGFSSPHADRTDRTDRTDRNDRNDRWTDVAVMPPSPTSARDADMPMTPTGICDGGDPSSNLANGRIDNPDEICVACDFPTIIEELTGSCGDLRSAVYQVATAFVVREEEGGEMVDVIREARVAPKTRRAVPRVPLIRDGTEVLCERRVILYV